ncbi:mechanosensitive ion channel family protein [Sellimonas intestinalis]|uniref:mechanosensitive ion channel family protein n=1 Tax=Sellimonas intestinalis TaxID=1653434 RepID=UPI0015EB92FD|nr:mechanosensitive ion channel domain-containing protein [Sellimonas intestinalis]MBA2213791.1 mechanosensitive ion channel [Sellimonas intestinalis]
MYYTLLTDNTAESVTENIQQKVATQTSFAVDFFHENLPKAINFGVGVVFALIFFLIGRILINWVRKLVRASIERSAADKGVEQFVDSCLKTGLYAILILSIIVRFGVDTSTVAALLASGGVAIGLALQGSLSNFAGGVLILLLKPFSVGDYIIEHSDNLEGTVKEIQIFYTKLSTVDNKTIVIPNGNLSNNSLTNVTAMDLRRLDFYVRIGYDEDLKKTEQIIRSVMEQEDRVIKEKEHTVFVDDLAESYVALCVRLWLKSDEFWNARADIMERTKLALDQAGIRFAGQKIDIVMKEQ